MPRRDAGGRYPVRGHNFTEERGIGWTWGSISPFARRRKSRGATLHELIGSGVTPKPVYITEMQELFSHGPVPSPGDSEEKVRPGLSDPNCGRGTMKKHLNTLFITTQGAYLSKDGETVVVKVQNEIRLRMPVHTIGGIVCFGNVLCSPFLLGFCAENGVAVSFLTEHGRFLARVQGPVSGNVLLRRGQYRKADDPKAMVEIVRSVLTGKLANCRTVLQRALRDHGEKVNVSAIKEASSRMTHYLERLGRERIRTLCAGSKAMPPISISAFSTN